MTTEQRTPAYLLLCAAALTSSWTGLRIGPLQPVDWLLLLCALAALTSYTRETLRPPAWMIALAVPIALVAVMHRILPTNSLYLAGRFRLDAGAALGGVIQSPGTAAVQWLVAVVAVPLIAVTVLARAGKSAAPMMWCWAIGASLSAAVSLTDFYGITSIGPSRLKITDALGGRQPGLASHANNLGFACAVAAPIVLYQLSRARQRLLCVAMLVVLGGGALVSGSRGSQVGFLLGLLFALVYSPQGRRMIPIVIYVAALVVTVIVGFAPDLFSGFSGVLRFSQQAGAASDEGRGLIAQQGLRDFKHNPLFGVGLEHLTEAHSIYIQLAASGGVILLGGFLFFVTALVVSLVRVRHLDALAAFLIADIAVWLASGIIENQLTDRYLYFPVAAAAFLAYRLRTGADVAEPQAAVRSRATL